MLIQNTNDMGNILLQRSSGSTMIRGLSFSTLITTNAPIAEHMKCIHDTDKGNLKSSFCQLKIEIKMQQPDIYQSHHISDKKQITKIIKKHEDNFPIPI